MSIFKLPALFSKNMAMDLGTANTLIYLKGAGIVLNEPSVVAYNTYTKEILAVGASAKKYLGRTPQHISAIRPLKDGVIADFVITQAMIRSFFLKIQKMSRFFKPKVVICVPTGITQVEKKAVIEAAEEVGCGKVYLIEEPMAAAIGSGLDVFQNKGRMIIDIGGGTTEVAVITMSSVAYCESLRVAGDELNEAIIRHLFHQHKIYIGENTAEKCKIATGSAIDMPGLEPFTLIGKNVLTSNPKEVTLTPQEIRIALQEPVKAIVEAVRRALDKTPTELVTDIYDEGIYMAGGGSLLRGLDTLIENTTKIPCHLTRDPLLAIAMGSGIALENLKDYQKVFIN
ncbi:MAG: rod shape-determining protein [Desulfurivibrio sp.]|jgi:rod shape-determining protein MreB|nr:MAG: rod shape-determining protein [Desulfurivibrio sp.]